MCNGIISDAFILEACVVPSALHQVWAESLCSICSCFLVPFFSIDNILLLQPGLLLKSQATTVPAFQHWLNSVGAEFFGKIFLGKIWCCQDYLLFLECFQIVLMDDNLKETLEYGAEHVDFLRLGWCSTVGLVLTKARNLGCWMHR